MKLDGGPGNHDLLAPNTTSSDLVFTRELIQCWQEDFAALWNDAEDEAYLREQERQAASLGIHPFFLLSWNVACVPAGPPTKHGALSRNAQHFAKLLRDLDEISGGPCCACENSPRQLETWLQKRQNVTSFLQSFQVQGTDAWRLLSQQKSLHASSLALSA